MGLSTPPVTVVGARPTGVRAAGAATATVCVFALGTWLATGVSARDVAAFLAFELLFVVAPGIVLYRALSHRPGGVLRHISIGSGLGYALSIFAFAATATVGIRGAFLAYPAVVVVPAAVVAHRKHGALLPLAGESPSPPRSLALAAVAVIALGYIAADLFGPVPLPERVPSVTYHQDLVLDVSLSAEALHHFPIEDPSVAGEPFSYHTFVFLHLASVAQVTGIELTTIVFRLWIVPAVMLLVLQFAFAGRHFTGQAWAGPVAAGLFLLAGELDLGSERPYPLIGARFSAMLFSPTFLLGLLLFIPLLVLLHERLVPSDSRRRASSEWALVGLFLAGCSGAKGSILPVVLGGLLTLGAWRLLTSHRSGPGMIGALSLTVAVLLVSYVLLYSGGGTDLHLKPLKSGVVTWAGLPFTPDTGESKVLLYPIGAGVTAIALMGGLVGLGWALRRPGRLGDTQVWLLGLLLTSVGIFFATDHPGVSQSYFLWYGFAAGVFLSAGGLVDASEAVNRLSRRARLSALAGACGLGALLLVDGYSDGDRLWPGIQGGLLFLGAGVLAWFALTRRAVVRDSAAAVAVAGGILLAGAIDGPLMLFPESVDRWSDPKRLVYNPEAPQGPRGLTTELRRGLRWVRDTTDSEEVFAVNNHFLDPTTHDSRYFYYSALTERRVFLESWDITNKTRRIGLEKVRGGVVPFPQRLALNDSAVGGNRRALERLASVHGVDYVLIDKLHGPAPRRRPGARVFSNGALDVYRID
jgi:hypothetical protein